MAQRRQDANRRTTLDPTPPTPKPPTAAARWQRAAVRAVLPLLALPLLLALVLTGALGVFGANWARGPIAHWAQLQTGRPLQIQGDLHLGLGWPLLRLQAQGLRFANPGWAQAPQELAADHADVQLDLRALLHGRLLLPTVALERPVLMLETAADGRKSWLLDRSQRDERTAVQIGLLTLQQGRIGYDDTGQQTHIRLTVATAGERTDLPRPGPTSGLGAPTDVLFSASGMLRGQALQASGRGASVLGLRDETVPYPLMLEESIGPTRLRADGRITGMARLAAVDLQVAVRGGSLAQLQPLLGLGLPATPAYAITGHLLRQGDRWQSQGFSGQLGRSDLAGNLQLVLGGVRPLLRGDIASRLLDRGGARWRSGGAINLCPRPRPCPARSAGQSGQGSSGGLNRAPSGPQRSGPPGWFRPPGRTPALRRRCPWPAPAAARRPGRSRHQSAVHARWR